LAIRHPVSDQRKPTCTRFDPSAKRFYTEPANAGGRGQGSS
jgi:hypothetical protein